MRKVELLPTRDCQAGYGPAAMTLGTGIALVGLYIYQMTNSGANMKLGGGNFFLGGGKNIRKYQWSMQKFANYMLKVSKFELIFTHLKCTENNSCFRHCHFGPLCVTYSSNLSLPVICTNQGNQEEGICPPCHFAIIRGGFREARVPPLIFAETGHLTVCGHPGTTAFLFKKWWHPLYWIYDSHIEGTSCVPLDSLLFFGGGWRLSKKFCLVCIALFCVIWILHVILW